MPTPFDQSRYQVRFDWGSAALRRLAPADVVVVVDAIPEPSLIEELSVQASETGALVLHGDLRTATAVARAIAGEQGRRGRTSVALVAAGGEDAEGTRFTIEDLLAAGAIVDALGGVGIDHTSPEAAAASEAFRGLRGAVRHLLTATGSGQELLEQDGREAVLGAAAIDADPVARLWAPAP